MDLKLRDLHVFITGSAGGIGLATAQHYLEQGARVSLHFNQQKDTLQELLIQYPDHTIAVHADATKESSVVECFQTAVSKFGLCHILIANHAIYESQEVPIDRMSLAQWQKNIDVNLTGVFLFVREFCKQLRSFTTKMTPKQKKCTHASVVIIGSTAGKFGEADHIDYATIKSGLMYGFTRSLKNEIVKIIPRATVNTVAPGWTRTPMAESALKQGLHLKALRTSPLGKVAESDDVARTILFVSSPVGGHLSGNVIMVDGGMEGRVLWTEEDLKARL